MLIVIISIDTMGIDGLNPFVSMDSIEGTHLLRIRTLGLVGGHWIDLRTVERLQ